LSAQWARRHALLDPVPYRTVSAVEPTQGRTVDLTQAILSPFIERLTGETDLGWPHSQTTVGAAGRCGGGRGHRVPRVSADDIVQFNPKHVIYEVFGDPGAVATVNYQDVHAAPQRADHVALPWKYEIITTDPAVIANLVAQGNGNTLGCRITINDVVKDERIVNEVNAYTFCLDKSG
jgi:hypothetical protein